MKHPGFHSSMFLQLLILLFLTGSASAQQSQDFDDYEVHYNAFNTDLIPPQVAKGYGIKRSSSRALINITVLKKAKDEPGTPVRASIEVGAVNLTGQRRDIELREISEDTGAIYYIGEFPVRNMESFAFKITATPEAETKPLEVEFRHQFYTE
jgi:hypothetical protein